jgi:hypothetical protein
VLPIAIHSNVMVLAPVIGLTLLSYGGIAGQGWYVVFHFYNSISRRLNIDGFVDEL